MAEQQIDFKPEEPAKVDFKPESSSKEPLGFIDTITDTTKKFLNEHPEGKKFLTHLMGDKTPEDLEMYKKAGINPPQSDFVQTPGVQKGFDYLADKIDNPKGEGGYVRGAIAGGLHGLGSIVAGGTDPRFVGTGESPIGESVRTVNPGEEIGPLRRMGHTEDFNARPIDLHPNNEGTFEQTPTAPQTSLQTTRTPHELPQLTQTTPPQAPIRDIPIGDDYKNQQVDKYLNRPIEPTSDLAPFRESQMPGQGRNYLDLIDNSDKPLDKKELWKQAVDNHINPRYYDTDSQEGLQELKADVDNKGNTTIVNPSSETRMKPVPGMGRNYLDLIHPEEPEPITQEDLSKAYGKIPEMPIQAAGPKKFFIYDSGGKYSNEELTNLVSSPKIQELATSISNTIHDVLRTTGNADLDNKLEKMGFVFDDSLDGIHIPNPNGPSAAILINPFEHIVNSSYENKLPNQTASDILNTIFHELAHLRVNNHGDEFIEALAKIHSDFGEKNSLDTQSNILKAIGDEKYPDQYNPEIQNLLSQYTSSRGRTGSQDDILLRTGIRSENTRNRKDPLSNDDKSNGERIATETIGKLKQSIQDAIPIREEQEAGYSSERGRRITAAENVKTPGEAGFYKQLGKLKGELPKEDFESIRPNFTQEEIDSLFDHITNSSNLQSWQKINAKEGLAKLLGEMGGEVPQRSEIKLLSSVFGKDIDDIIMMHGGLGVPGGFKLVLNEVINVPKSIMASMDFSAPLRQGLPLIHKKAWWTSLDDMFKAFGSEESFNALQQSIEDRPYYNLGRQAGLSITDSEVISSREEAFLSAYAERIPGIGHMIRASDRAYMGFLNKLRADTFDSLVDDAKEMGMKDKELLNVARNIAQYVNVSTGRGSLGRLEKMAVELNAVFFSPRMIASRIQMLNPNYYIKLDPFTRKEALKSILAVTGVAVTVAGLGKLAGGKVETNPLSADFMKTKFGDTRIDPMAGFQQYIVAASRLIANKEVSSSSGKEIKFGEGFNAPTRLDLVKSFAENKLSPIAGFVDTMLKGKDFNGNPVSVKKEIADRLTPMVLSDIYSIYKSDPKLLPLGIAGVFGFGIQTYSNKDKNPFGKMKLGM